MLADSSKDVIIIIAKRRTQNTITTGILITTRNTSITASST